MKKFFYHCDFTAIEHGNITEKFVWGIAEFNLDMPITEQMISIIQKNPAFDYMGNLQVTALNPIELDSSNHTDRVLELFRIYVNNREYYGGMNTNAYVQKELNKLGLSLYE